MRIIDPTRVGFAAAALGVAYHLVRLALVALGREDMAVDAFVRVLEQQPDAELLDAWGLGGKFVCSYVGTIGMAHGLEVVIEAAKILRSRGRQDVGFCLVGDGASRRRLEEQAQQAGVDDLEGPGARAFRFDVRPRGGHLGGCHLVLEAGA